MNIRRKGNSRAEKLCSQMRTHPPPEMIITELNNCATGEMDKKTGLSIDQITSQAEHLCSQMSGDGGAEQTESQADCSPSTQTIRQSPTIPGAVARLNMMAELNKRVP